METEKNIYGLPEGIFKACLFLGLEFPPEVPKELSASQEHVPSDYFGNDVELDAVAKRRLCSELLWTEEKLTISHEQFSKKFMSQRCFRHTKTDLNVYFVDYLLFASKMNGAAVKNYFYFAFYKKSFAVRSTFFTQREYWLRQIICNELNYRPLLRNKSRANNFFSNFLHRDWLDICNCTFEEFLSFVEKHPRFFFKPTHGDSGRGTHVIQIEPNQDLKELFEQLLAWKGLVEELIVQHKDLAAFCPDTTNTLRIATLYDIHNVVHILTTSGRFGRMGTITDNFTIGGYSVIVNPKTGIITSDGMNNAHEFFQQHPDTGKTFKGFQYPFWEKILDVVTKMAMLVPQIRHIGWDITLNDAGEVVLVEANDNADVNIQQAPDDTGRLYLYKPLLEEMRNYKKEQMQLLGWRVNNLRNFDSSYQLNPKFWNPRRKFAMNKLIPACKSLMDLGCRKEMFVKSFCPANVKYFPVDYVKHDAEVIACNFNEGEFPDIKADTCFCVLTAEFVETLPQFLANMCNAAQKQILMWCRPVDKETRLKYRWEKPLLTDFTEEFLINTLAQNGFELSGQYPEVKNPSIILYDFRKTPLT